MLNQVVLAGRLTGDPVKEEKNEKGLTQATIIVAVPEAYKNIDGTYNTNYIKVSLIGGIAESTVDYCKKGDIVGVKGRIKTDNNGDIVQIVAEKVSFLSSRREENKGE